MRENTFNTKIEGGNVSIFGFEKWIGREGNNDISAVALVEWEFYTEMREWGVKNVGAYATIICIEFEVNWWNENDEEEVEEVNDTSNENDKWEIETTSELQFGDSICPQDVEVDYDTKTITINF